MSRRNFGVAGKGELTEPAALPPVAQMPADRSGSGLHDATLTQAPDPSNYLRGNPFLTSDVIEFASAVGDIRSAGIATMR